MRTLCDSCEAAPARFFCAADEAALCPTCDEEVHGCNKLASRHVRLELTEVRAVRNCDICEKASAFFFCGIDGTSLCFQCDMDVHVGGKRTHERYLLMGQRVEVPKGSPKVEGPAANRMEPAKDRLRINGQEVHHHSLHYQQRDGKKSNKALAMAIAVKETESIDHRLLNLNPRLQHLPGQDAHTGQVVATPKQKSTQSSLPQFYTPLKKTASRLPDDPWVVIRRLQEELRDLAAENALLRRSMTGLETRLLKIEEHSSHEALSTPSPAVVDTVTSLVRTQLDGQFNQLLTQKVEGQVQTQLQEHTKRDTEALKVEVDSQIQEQKRRDLNALKIRIGGLPEGWYANEDSFEETKDKVFAATPQVSWVSEHISRISDTAGYAILQFQFKEARLEILKQSKLLKGTRLWISEELTPSQLKQKKTELEKVKAARLLGKWAAYREGKAMIRDFFRPKNG